MVQMACNTFPVFRLKTRAPGEPTLLVLPIRATQGLRLRTSVFVSKLEAGPVPCNKSMVKMSLYSQNYAFATPEESRTAGASVYGMISRIYSKTSPTSQEAINSIKVLEYANIVHSKFSVPEKLFTNDLPSQGVEGNSYTLSIPFDAGLINDANLEVNPADGTYMFSARIFEPSQLSDAKHLTSKYFSGTAPLRALFTGENSFQYFGVPLTKDPAVNGNNSYIDEDNPLNPFATFVVVQTQNGRFYVREVTFYFPDRTSEPPANPPQVPPNRVEPRARTIKFATELL